MAKKDYTKFTVDPKKIKVRDELIKNMITSNGGVARVFADRKRQSKADKTGRKAKYRSRDAD